MIVKVGVSKKRTTNSVKVTQNSRRSANRRLDISDTYGTTSVVKQFYEISVNAKPRPCVIMLVPLDDEIRCLEITQPVTAIDQTSDDG